MAPARSGSCARSSCPQAIPAIVAVTLFHFFFAWNEFLLSLVYVGGNPDLWPLSLGMQKFASLYVTRPPLVQASAILAIAVPVVVFFLSQRAFMRGVVVTGRGQVTDHDPRGRSRRRVSSGRASRARRGVAAWVSRALTSGTHASRDRWSTTASGPGSRSVAWARGASGGRSVATSRGGTSRSDSIGSSRSLPTASRCIVGPARDRSGEVAGDTGWRPRDRAVRVAPGASAGLGLGPARGRRHVPRVVPTRLADLRARGSRSPGASHGRTAVTGHRRRPRAECAARRGLRVVGGESRARPVDGRAPVHLGRPAGRADRRSRAGTAARGDTRPGTPSA